jgi:hypothetical protein
MRKIITSLAIASLLYVNPNAQTVVVSVDKSTFGEANNSVWEYELDGDFNTQEYLSIILDPATNILYYKTIRFCPDGRMLKGNWFNPWDSIQPIREFTIGGVVWAYGKYVWSAQGMRFKYTVNFDLPSCEG